MLQLSDVDLRVIITFCCKISVLCCEIRPSGKLAEEVITFSWRPTLGVSDVN